MLNLCQYILLISDNSFVRFNPTYFKFIPLVFADCIYHVLNFLASFQFSFVFWLKYTISGKKNRKSASAIEKAIKITSNHFWTNYLLNFLPSLLINRVTRSNYTHYTIITYFTFLLKLLLKCSLMLCFLLKVQFQGNGFSVQCMAWPSPSKTYT